MKNECSHQPDISSFLDGELTKAEERNFKQHLQQCELCKNEIAIMKRIDAKYDQLLKQIPLEKAIAAKVNAENQSIVINNSIVIGSDLNTGTDLSVKLLVQKAQQLRARKRLFRKEYMKISAAVLLIIFVITANFLSVKADFNINALNAIKAELENNAEVYLCFTRQSYRTNLSQDNLNEFLNHTREKLPFNFIDHIEDRNQPWEQIRLKQHGIQYAVVADISKDGLAKGTLTLFYQKPQEDMHWNGVKTVNSSCEESNWISALSANLSLKLGKELDIFKGPESESSIPMPTEIRQDVWNVCWKGQWFDFTQSAWVNLPHSQQVEYAKAYQNWYAQSVSQPVEKTFQGGGTKFIMRLIPPGKFFMGSPDNENGRKDDERRQSILIEKPFWIQKTEISRNQWSTVTGENPWLKAKDYIGENDYYVEKNDEHPAALISYEDICEKFLPRLGEKFALPTEYQWEYACKAGTLARFYWGESENEMGKYANVRDLSTKKKHPSWEAIESEDGFHYIAPVGKLKPNAFGLHDMIGNIWEWCKDWYKKYPEKDIEEPLYKVIRGGAWDRIKVLELRSSNRNCSRTNNRGYDLGARLVIHKLD